MDVESNITNSNSGEIDRAASWRNPSFRRHSSRRHWQGRTWITFLLVHPRRRTLPPHPGLWAPHHWSEGRTPPNLRETWGYRNTNTSQPDAPATPWKKPRPRPPQIQPRGVTCRKRSTERRSNLLSKQRSSVERHAVVMEQRDLTHHRRGGPPPHCRPASVLGVPYMGLVARLLLSQLGRALTPPGPEVLCFRPWRSVHPRVLLPTSPSRLSAHRHRRARGR